MSADRDFRCMMCDGPALDAPTGGETDWAWIDRKLVAVRFWVYCRACDCWTEHPLVSQKILEQNAL